MTNFLIAINVLIFGAELFWKSPPKMSFIEMGGLFASGAIMGIFGVMGAIHLLGWQKGKSKSAAREFRGVLFGVGFQLVFDLANGHTSIVGHLSGFAIGFLVGLGLLLISPPRFSEHDTSL